MFQLLLLLASVALALAGRSPHADFVEATFGTASSRYSCNILEDAKLDVVGLATKYRYPIESHVVVTDDEYVLTMHRIPAGRDRNNRRDPKKPIVFLMHGLLSSSADWLLMGPGNALAYLLAEEGYDVWMGNARGNFYSRQHRRLNPDSNQDFWRFSWDEIGNLDLPAMLNYIERHTGQSRLHYIGHSQGGTSFLVLTSLRPEYNNKFISFQGYAPASYFTHNVHPTFTALAPYVHILEPAVFGLGRAEVFGNREFMTWFATNFCYGGAVFETLCVNVMARETDYFNQTMVPLKLGHTPAGASIRQFAHYGQSIKDDTFRRYNFNILTNLRVYGSTTPPEYNMGLITTPTYLHYADNDLLVHPHDVEKLASKLPNLQVLNKLQSKTFDHVDFIWGKGAKQVLYLDTISLMRQAEMKFGRS